jgi:hypothetical protein
VAPTRIGVGVPLALGAVVVDVTLTIRERGHVARVNGNVSAVLRQRVLLRGRDTVETVSQNELVRPQLDREAVAGPTARGAAENILQAGMLGDEGGDSRPSRATLPDLNGLTGERVFV